VLTIRPISPQSLSYYDLETEVEQERGLGYYESQSKQRGMWFGRGRHAFGLDGSVDSREYRNVFQGYSPTKTVALVQNAGRIEGKRARRPGFDFTFSAPKDFSLLFSATTSETERQRLLRCHDDAVVFVLDLLEDRLAKTRIGKAGQYLIDAKGLIGARFLHHTSRENDPQVHTHCLIANLAQGPDARWRALASTRAFTPGLMKTYGTLYREILGSNLEQTFSIQVTMACGYLRIPGIPSETRAYYSKRRAQIEAVGYRDARESGQVAVHTRKSKDKAVSFEALSETWRQELAATFGPDFTVEKLAHRQRHADLEACHRITQAAPKAARAAVIGTLEADPANDPRAAIGTDLPVNQPEPSIYRPKRAPDIPSERHTMRAAIHQAFRMRPSKVVTWLETAIRRLNSLERVRVRHIARTAGEMRLGPTSLSEVSALATIYRESGMRFLALTRSSAEAAALSQHGPRAMAGFALLQMIGAPLFDRAAYNSACEGSSERPKRAFGTATDPT
jgi:conjugative relaxase-like TrwC/TraI family protein